MTSEGQPRCRPGGPPARSAPPSSGTAEAPAARAAIRPCGARGHSRTARAASHSSAASRKTRSSGAANCDAVEFARDEPGIQRLPRRRRAVASSARRNSTFVVNAEARPCRRARRSMRRRGLPRSRRPGDRPWRASGRSRLETRRPASQRAVDPDARRPSARRSTLHVPPVGRKPRRRVLGVDARLDRRARSSTTSSCVERQRLARGDAQLLLDQVEPVTTSVTGCSTCSRVFISMKKNSSGRVVRRR